jgi:hypothetical protein
MRTSAPLAAAFAVASAIAAAGERAARVIAALAADL